jgi:outer membrane lipoprotein carrier protein
MKFVTQAFGFVLLCSLSLALSAMEQTEPAADRQNAVAPGAARAQLETFSAGLETLHARFEQQVISTDGAVEDRSSGEVWLQRPQRFRWEYGGDFPEVVVADGERVWIYDQALEQVTVEDQSNTELASPLTLLTEPGRLDEQFAVREAGEADGLQILELRAQSAENEFERILLGLRGNALELMIMEDAFGLRTELRFHDVERNPAVDPARFTFTPPEGVDVIGDVAIIRPLD